MARTIEPVWPPPATGQNTEPAPACPPGTASLSLNQCPEGTAVLVTLPAEIDVSNDDQVRAMLADALDRRPAVVIADGTRTTFCGSSGSTRLLEAHYRAAAAGAQLRLVAPAAEVRRILQVTGAASELRVFTSLEAAAQDSGMPPPPEASAAVTWCRPNPGPR
jgi:anti-sigma B factor antagonist